MLSFRISFAGNELFRGEVGMLGGTGGRGGRASFSLAGASSAGELTR